MKPLLATLLLCLSASAATIQSNAQQVFPVADVEWQLYQKSTVPAFSATSWSFPSGDTYAGYFLQDLWRTVLVPYTSSPNGRGRVKYYEQRVGTPVLGDTLIARFNVTADASTLWHFYGTAGTMAPHVRVYFQMGGLYNSTIGTRWWSNPANFRLDQANGQSIDVTITVPLTPDNWSSTYGERGTSLPTEFANAKANATFIGFTFGGGNHFGHGVNVTGGNARFTLYSVHTE